MGKVIITNPSRPVYSDNDNHRLIYGPLLYSSADEIRKKYLEDSLKAANAKKVKPKKVEKEPKRGLKKFFDKIFNKKDKNRKC